MAYRDETPRGHPLIPRLQRYLTQDFDTAAHDAAYEEHIKDLEDQVDRAVEQTPVSLNQDHEEYERQIFNQIQGIQDEHDESVVKELISENRWQQSRALREEFYRINNLINRVDVIQANHPDASDAYIFRQLRMLPGLEMLPRDRPRLQRRINRNRSDRQMQIFLNRPSSSDSDDYDDSDPLLAPTDQARINRALAEDSSDSDGDGLPAYPSYPTNTNFNIQKHKAAFMSM